MEIAVLLSLLSLAVNAVTLVLLAVLWRRLP
jgi:hypothetical protein